MEAVGSGWGGQKAVDHNVAGIEVEGKERISSKQGSAWGEGTERVVAGDALCYGGASP